MSSSYSDLSPLKAPLLGSTAAAVEAIAPAAPAQLPLAACLLGNLGILFLMVGAPSMALFSFAAAVPFVVGAVMLKMKDEIPRVLTSRTGSILGKCLAVVQLMMPAAWLLVGILLDDPEFRLLAGILMVVGTQSPWWEILILLVPQVLLSGIMGSFHEPVCWAPAAIFAVLATNLTVGSIPRFRTQSLTAEFGQAASMNEFRQDSLVRTRSGYIKALKGLPDWAPPTKNELQSWESHFALHEEQLIGVYACSVKTKVTNQGRLYISFGGLGQGHLCFRGIKLLRSTIEFIVQVDNVKEVRSSADGVITLLLKQPIMMKGQRELFPELEFRTGERGTAALNSLFARRGSKQEDDAALEASDDDEDEPDVLTPPSTSCTSIPDDGQPYNKLIEAKIPSLPMSTIKDELMNEVWKEPNFYFEFISELGATQIEIGGPIDESDRSGTVHVREVTMVMPVPPAPMCPKTTRVTTTVRTFFPVNTSAVIVETSTQSHDVPFGANFVVQQRIEMAWDETEHHCSLSKSARLIFLKSVGWLKGTIQSSAMTTQAKGGDVLLSVLKRRAVGTRRNQGRVTEVGMVWELQRRTTIFTSDWRAPFLPHDGEKRWRWVDASYTKHHWLPNSANREDISCRAFPPLESSTGWTMRQRWEVNRPEQSNNTDRAGWQYAVDFYRTDKLWVKSSTGKHCRRRLWVCEIEEEASTSPSPV
mmetsp:Transcript_86578/g.181373  ORF Transcript_86578/g.181373 Transcript_86578/m.181373 type:complete len:703 (+) Transcript_86578:91-2199(+)